ncbi:MAG: site-2 protease family protein [Phycisphaerales bacterium]|nr:site-2 protease family protein [Phycisphaerales bacterium]
MFDLPGPLGTIANFLVIVVGFGSIIFIHELGHFVAAKWAGIRVLAFSIGFGNVLVSYRKGIGFRRGSSDREYRTLVEGAKDGTVEGGRADLSPTEYRLSMLPLGGYVKMLGQEDINPEATSEAPDSYQNCPVGKRMVVICAGVVMNMLMAATLFIVVFMVGLKVLPPQVGFVPPNSPAANAIAIDNAQITTGIMRGDRIVSINGKVMHSFEAILPEIAMGSSTKPAQITIERKGVDGQIVFEATPEKSERSGLLDIGITPAISPRLNAAKDKQVRKQWERAAQAYGFGGLEPGDLFVSAEGRPVNSPFDLLDRASDSGGQPINTIIDRNGETIHFALHPIPELQIDPVEAEDGLQGLRHILGLAGVMMVDPDASAEDTKQGLEPGDIFERIGSVQFPSVPEGIEKIHASAGEPLDLVVLRKNTDSSFERVKLSVEVTVEGTIGFYPSETTSRSNFVSKPAMFSQLIAEDTLESAMISMPASTLIEYPGSRIAAIGETPISNLHDIRAGILKAVDLAYQAGDETFTVPVTLELPLPTQPDGTIPTTTTDWTLSRDDIDSILELGWTLPGSTAIVTMFEYTQIIDKADSPVGAIKRGVAESQRVMLQTYITFLRLFEGSVKVEHLKGPVGIAHIGTQIASQGWVWVLFFMALISINLAVINFLPLPIVDGGQFLMLVYEWIRGKPVPIIFQNVATMAGLLMIGTIFLYVTFNDIKALFGV